MISLHWVLLITTIVLAVMLCQMYVISWVKKWNVEYLYKIFFRVTNSTSQKMKFHFDLVTRKLNFYFSTFELLTRSRKIKFYFELQAGWVNFYFITFKSLTQGWKIKSSTWS